MKIKIEYATQENIQFANKYLTNLIRDEKKYDKNINDNCVVNEYYENICPSDDNILLFAKYDNNIVGYLFGYRENTGDTYLKNIAKLDAIFVEDKYRLKGIGKELINEFEHWAKLHHISYVELSVCSKNNEAVNLYKKNGYMNLKNVMVKDLEV